MLRDSTASTPSWKTTTIWQELSRKETAEADPVRALLETCMPDIERILASGGTSPLDFTLHDDGHAFRVAQRMAEIIPDDVLPQLSTYELALLLLSAYLHDIGMTPEQRKVQTLYTFLLTNDSQDLPESEKKEFEKWLDENRPGLAPPIADPNNPHSYRIASEAITYYCRDRHVEWGDAWIRGHLHNLRLGTYNGWIDDLVLLCRSHHEGYNELKKDRFNPRPVGSPAVIVHLRYLAVALRVGDVLEFDPERTPDVILRHRNVSERSLIYWWKDLAMSTKLERPRIVISARPQTAQIHKAVETTVHDINAELGVSRRLADETHFHICPGLSADLPHEWDLLPAVHLDIQPKDESYVYIDGAFRPDTQKLLQLLSGVELYGNELVAVRELLQNAFDAVREKMAYERLYSPEPTDPSIEGKLSELNHVDLRVEVSDDGTWLVCLDTGVGMTKALIQDHLLVSGVASRHDVLELERRCKRAGFTLGRTGQFGIGVLSYFMLADRVVIRTKRTQQPGDSDNEGWNFETEGVGSFGELRRDSGIPAGTEVRLHLRQELIGGDIAEWHRKLLSYLRTELSRVPCSFSVKSTIPGAKAIYLKPGFTYNPDQLADLTTRRFVRRHGTDDETPVEVLPARKRQQLEAEQKHWVRTLQEFRQHLRWETKEGELPENLGKFRIHLPYFELPGGSSFAFLRPREENGCVYLDKVGKGYCCMPKADAVFSWKGMRLVRSLSNRHVRSMSNVDWRTQPASIVEVDWAPVDAGTIGVNRHEIDLSTKARRAITWLGDQFVEMCREFLTRTQQSAYSSLNLRLMEKQLEAGAKANWLVVRKNSKTTYATWEELKVPLITVLSLVYAFHPETEAKWNSIATQIVHCLGDEDDDDPYDGLSWHPRHVPPDRICARNKSARPYNAYFFGMSPLWTDNLSSERLKHPAGLVAQFPPKWNRLCGARFESYSSRYEPVTIWNPPNIIVRTATSDAWTWCRETFKLRKSLDPLPLKGSLLMEKARIASWILMCLETQQSDLWDGLRDRDASFLPTALNLALGEEWNAQAQATPEVIEWVEDTVDTRLRILTPLGWRAYKHFGNQSKILEYLPDPGPDWTVTIYDPEVRDREKRET